MKCRFHKKCELYRKYNKTCILMGEHSHCGRYKDLRWGEIIIPEQKKDDFVSDAEFIENLKKVVISFKDIPEPKNKKKKKEELLLH